MREQALDLSIHRQINKRKRQILTDVVSHETAKAPTAPELNIQKGITVVVTPDQYALIAKPPVASISLTSWLWPEWQDGPAEVHEGVSNSEIYIYKREPESRPAHFASFAEVFKSAVSVEYGDYEINERWLELESLDKLAEPHVPTSMQLAA